MVCCQELPPGDWDLLEGFFPPLSHLTPSLRGSPRELSSSYLVWETRMAGHDDRLSWAQYTNVTDTQTAASP